MTWSQVRLKNQTCKVYGVGIDGYKYKKGIILDAQNSGTLGRLIAGILINSPYSIKIIGDRDVNTNLRYKQGKNLNYNKSDVFEITSPSEYYLPSQNISSRYIFAKEDLFFVYQNNFNRYVNLYKNTYQHGGISMEEMLIPIVTLKSK